MMSDVLGRKNFPLVFLNLLLEKMDTLKIENL